MSTFDIIVDLAAKEICKVCDKDNYATFNDMCKTYSWGTEEVREFVTYTVASIAQNNESDSVYMVDGNGTLIIETEGAIYPYGEFIAAIRKKLKTMGK